MRKDGFQNVYNVWRRSQFPYGTLSKLIKADCFSSLKLKRVKALWESQALRYQEKISLFKSSLSNYLNQQQVAN